VKKPYFYDENKRNQSAKIKAMKAKADKRGSLMRNVVSWFKKNTNDDELRLLEPSGYYEVFYRKDFEGELNG